MHTTRKEETKKVEGRTSLTTRDSSNEAKPEGGIKMMTRMTLLQPARKKGKELVQRNSIFRIIIKMISRCYSMIFHRVSTKNLVSTEVIDKLVLKCQPPPNSYRVS